MPFRRHLTGHSSRDAVRVHFTEGDRAPPGRALGLRRQILSLVFGFSEIPRTLASTLTCISQMRPLCLQRGQVIHPNAPAANGESGKTRSESRCSFLSLLCLLHHYPSDLQTTLCGRYTLLLLSGGRTHGCANACLFAKRCEALAAHHVCHFLHALCDHGGSNSP